MGVAGVLRLLSRLEEITVRAADETLDADALLRLDFEFYVELARASRNRVFQLLINTIRTAVIAYAGVFAAFNGPADKVRRHHREILRALAARDADKTAAAADAHLRRSADQVLEVFPRTS